MLPRQKMGTNQMLIYIKFQTLVSSLEQLESYGYKRLNDLILTAWVHYLHGKFVDTIRKWRYYNYLMNGLWFMTPFFFEN